MPLELLNKEDEARYQPGHSPRHQDKNEEEEAKHQTTLCLRCQAKTEEEEPKYQAGEPSREAAKLESFQARDQVTQDRQEKCQSSLSGDSKGGSNGVDNVRLLELGTIDKEETLARPILFSNWRCKNHTPVERGKRRDYTKARHKMFYEEELDGPLVLINEELDNVLRIDRISQVHNRHSGEDLDEDRWQELCRSGRKDEKIGTILDELGNIDKEKLLARPILVSNWRNKNYNQEERGKPRDYTLPLEIFNEDRHELNTILLSNWRNKNYIQVERGKLRDYTKARLKVLYEEERDVPHEAMKDLPVDSAKARSVDAAKALSVDSAKDLSIDSSKALSVDSAKDLDVNSAKALAVDSAKDHSVDSAKALGGDSAKDHIVNSAKDLSADPAKNLSVDAAKALSVSQLQKTLAVKSAEHETKNKEANEKQKQRVNDQQEAKKQKQQSIESSQLGDKQTEENTIKKAKEMKDLERDEPAVTMREITVQHPAPKMTIEITWTQDEEVGDGTTSVIVRAAEMQGGSHQFQEEKRHPTAGIQAYRQAHEDGAVILKDTVATKIDLEDASAVRKVIQSCDGTKFIARRSDLACDIAMDTVKTVTRTGSATNRPETRRRLKHIVTR